MPLFTKMYSGSRVLVEVKDDDATCRSEMDFGSSGFRLASVCLWRKSACTGAQSAGHAPQPLRRHGKHEDVHLAQRIPRRQVGPHSAHLGREYMAFMTCWVSMRAVQGCDYRSGTRPQQDIMRGVCEMVCEARAYSYKKIRLSAIFCLVPGRPLTKITAAKDTDLLRGAFYMGHAVSLSRRIAASHRGSSRNILSGLKPVQ
jgi:hypothetical protein